MATPSLRARRITLDRSSKYRTAFFIGPVERSDGTADQRRQTFYSLSRLWHCAIVGRGTGRIYKIRYGTCPMCPIGEKKTIFEINLQNKTELNR